MAKSKLLPKLNGVIPSNELYINVNEPEVTGKQYQTFAAANAYILNEGVDANNPWTVRFSGYITEPLIALDYVSYVGEGESSSILAEVSLANAIVQGASNIYNCTIESLTMADIVTPGIPIVATVTRTQEKVITYAKIGPYMQGGFTTPAQFTADVAPTPYQIYIPYNNSKTINQGISDWNSAHPDNTCTLTQGNGNDVPKASVIIKISGGSVQNEKQLISFDNVPDTGEWIIKFQGNNYWCTQQLDINSTYDVIQNYIRLMFNDIELAEGVDYGKNTVVVSGDFTSGFSIELVDCPVPQLNLFEVPASTNAYWYGQLTGMTTSVRMEATVSGAVGNLAFRGDGVKTIQNLIDERNSENPTNTVALVFGDGSQISANGEWFIFTMGVDYNLEFGSGEWGQYLDLIHCKVLETIGSGYPTLTSKDCKYDYCDFAKFEKTEFKECDINECLLTASTTIAYGGRVTNPAIIQGAFHNTFMSASVEPQINSELFIYGGMITGDYRVDSGKSLYLTNTVNSAQIKLNTGGMLHTYDPAGYLVVSESGGDWYRHNDYAGHGSPIDNLITPVVLENGLPQRYCDLDIPCWYTATGTNPGDWILG